MGSLDTNAPQTVGWAGIADGSAVVGVPAQLGSAAATEAWAAVAAVDSSPLAAARREMCCGLGRPYSAPADECSTRPEKSIPDSRPKSSYPGCFGSTRTRYPCAVHARCTVECRFAPSAVAASDNAAGLARERSGSRRQDC